MEDEFLIEDEDFNPWDAWDEELEPLICRSMPSKAASAVLQSMPSQVSSAESPSKVVSPKKGNLNNGSPEHRQRVTSWHGEEYAQYYFQYFDVRKLQPTLSVDAVSRGLLPKEKTFLTTRLTTTICTCLCGVSSPLILFHRLPSGLLISESFSLL